MMASPDYRRQESMLESKTILVVAPHADDETFGCAGTIARAKSEGSSVFVIYVSTGDVRHRNANDPVVQATTREAEISRAAHNRVVQGERPLVSCELIVIPEALAQPRAAAGPHSPEGTVHGSGSPPAIGVVVTDPAAGPIVRLRGAPPRLCQIPDQPKKRLVALQKIRGRGGPVVHLRIDIDRVLAVPGRGE